ncbi:MAG: hypothetical protein IPM01_16420 [Burkholderiaceae bacterium]|nr:hypothetical protein [Burkholderiaceae bacterium]
MRNWYLWRDRMPNPDLSQFASAGAALKALTVSEDRFSYIDDAQTFNQFFDEGRTVGFGIGYTARDTSVWIRLIQPQSPAALAGLRRGDRILAINSVPSATLIAEGRLDAAFGPIEIGYSGQFSIERDGQVLDIRVIKQAYSLSSVLEARVIEANGRKIGYVNLYTFNSPARSAWSGAIAMLAGAGAQDLVVDLRDNSGGLLALAADIASSLAPADAPGKLFLRSEYNSAHSGSDIQYRFSALPGLGRFERLAWLTSERTCSASEALMIGLRPYRSSPVIGSTTCGKPVGFNPEQREGKVYNIVTFRLINSLGESDYFNGLAPTCVVNDDFRKPLGDPSESLFAAAIDALNGRACPSAPVPKATTTRPAPRRWDLAAQIGVK